jgi:hypothetical protein
VSPFDQKDVVDQLPHSWIETGGLQGRVHRRRVAGQPRAPLFALFAGVSEQFVVCDGEGHELD